MTCVAARLSPSAKPMKAAFSNAGLQASWCAQGKQAAEAWGKIMNVEITWFDGELAATKQRAAIDNMATQKWDFVAIQTFGIGTLTDPIQKMIDAGTPVPLRGTEDAILPTFSPDGRSVAFIVGSELRRLSLADGAITPISSRVRFPNDLLWHVDDRIYLADFGSRFSAVKASGGDFAPVGAQSCEGLIAAIRTRSDWLLINSGGAIGPYLPTALARRARRGCCSVGTFCRRT